MTDKGSSSVRLRKDRVMERKKETEQTNGDKGTRESAVNGSVNGDKGTRESAVNGSVNGDKGTRESAVNGSVNGDKGTRESAVNGSVNGDVAVMSIGAPETEKPEVMELPPFQIITGDRMDAFFFKFQYKNVEYSSGRNKTFLCYLVNEVRGAGDEAILRGYVEDEHVAGDHAEDAFFHLVLPGYEPSVRYTVTWYVSSSPCPSCASKLVKILQERQTLRLTIFSARLFEWEEPEVRTGLKALSEAGCKLRVMKPLDFCYTWDTFVEHDGQRLEPWEDCQENYEYYQDKLADILQ